MLPEGYTLRHPTTDDARAVAEMFSLNARHFGGSGDHTAAEMLAIWQEVELDKNAWLVVAPDGQVAGYEELIVSRNNTRFETDGTVHPQHWRMGIGLFLVGRVKARIKALRAVQDPGEAKPVVTVQINGKDESARALFRDFQLVKSDVVMKIALDQLPPQWQRSDGITVRRFVTGQDDRAVFEVIHTAFQSIRGFAERSASYERWRRSSVEREGFDPDLWFLATDGVKIVGVCLCPHDRAIGWIRNFAVLPDYQGRGIGETLLKAAFREWYQRGRTEVGLAVQGDNIPAIRLYEKAGMHVESVYEVYQQDLAWE